MAHTNSVRVTTRNDHFQHVETLRRNRAKRTHHRQFVVEGVRNLDAAVQFGWQIDELWYAPERPCSGWAAALLEATAAHAIVSTTAELLAELSERESPSEVMAVVRMRDDLAALEALPVGAGFVAVVLDRPASPGNLGSVVRTADALGASAVLVAGHAADPYDPQAVRAGMGSLFALPVLRVDGPQVVLDACTRWRHDAPGLRLVAAGAHGGVPPREAGLEPPLLLVLGNEATGLSRAFAEGCDATVQIPMQPRFANSLNLSAAAAILLYETLQGS